MLNQVILIGRVGQDVAMRELGGERCVANISVATSKSYKGRDDQWVEQTEWHTVEIWNQGAESAKKNISKGDLVYVFGEIKTEEYEKDGVKKRFTKILASTVRRLSPKKEGGLSEPATAKDPWEATQPHVPDDDLPF